MKPHAGATPVILTILIIVSAVAAGCSSLPVERGSFRCESRGEDAVYLPVEYQTVVFAREDDGQTCFIMSDIPESALLDGSVRSGQVTHVELLWEPKAGATPLERFATNACIRHIVLVDGELGVYGGAGFAEPSGRPEDGIWSFTIPDASIRLLEATPGFNDPLGPTRMVGSFNALDDPERTRRMHRSISQIVTDALDRTQLVRTRHTPENEQRPGMLRGVG